jgi:hypothetical protein
MFPWENFEGLGPFSVNPNRVDADSSQRAFDRQFRKQIKADRRLTRRAQRQERAIGARIERWKWQRFLDGDFSGFHKEFDEVVSIPVGGIMTCIVVLGMFIVQLDYVDEQWYRQFMLIALVILGSSMLLLRMFAFYAIRIWVSGYGQAYIEDKWILTSSGRVEDVAIVEEIDFDE